MMRYRPSLPLVLKGLDLDIPGGAKVGVVGRTGAGKSSLMVAMMRLVELDAGKIMIDGIDISRVGLETLRSKIAVIPQDPVLFSGTVRSNIDPFGSYNEQRLYDVLDRVGLYNDENSPIVSLDDEVNEGGSNYSVGQRQLLVIARALLVESKVVIMDEATASIDNTTDARIQKVMRSDFEKATCITIAHRLNTIMDSDYILVMDDGTVAEFGPPSSLLDGGGMFMHLVDVWDKEEQA